MAWADSRVFDRYPLDALARTTLMDIDTDSCKASLHNNSITPDRTVAAASTAYNTGVWTTTNEVTDATGWPAGGRALVSNTLTTPSGGVVMFDANDTVSANSTTTLTTCNGTLIYDDTIASPVSKQGIAFLYFGGGASVTSGQFTIVYHANGIWRATT